MKIVADENIPFAAQCFASIGDVELVPGRKMSADTVRDADCLLVRSITKVNEQLLSGSKAKFVATATIGLEHIDVEYLKSKGIGFASAPGSNANSVAEYIVAALLSVGKKHNIALEGKSIGIVGAGNVGSRVAKKCAALGMKLKLNDPPLQRYRSHREHRKHRDKNYEAALQRVQRYLGRSEFVQLKEIFNCDFVTLHTPLTREGRDKTYHLADDEFFASLKAGCVFINTSRGGVHDTAALKAAIQSGKLGAVVLDVWEDEPGIDCELLQMVDISTPHIAGYSLDGKIAGMVMIYKAVCAHFGLEPKHDIYDFLPEAEVPEVTIGHIGIDEQEVLRESVERVYVINRDDFNMRETTMVDEGKRAQFFDGLRKNYPVRREFFNTKVVITTEGTEIMEKMDSRLRGNDISREEVLRRKLEGIGFSI